MKEIILIFLILCLVKCQALELMPTHKTILKDIRWPLKVHIYDNIEVTAPTRRIGIQYLKSGRREYTEQEEYNLRVKLFRIMYEIVRDNDEQIKKAEEIMSEFSPSPYIQIGFTLSIINEKYKDMRKIGDTVSRLSMQWSPLEHVDAYEQIVNLYVEINSMLEIYKLAYKELLMNSSKGGVRSSWNEIEELIIHYVHDVLDFEKKHGEGEGKKLWKQNNTM